jgi:hypothetical protein
MSFLNAMKGLQQSFQEKEVGANNLGKLVSHSVISRFDSNFINKFITPPNEGAPSQQPAPGKKITLNPDTQNFIPVIYGSAYTSGIITDAIMSADNLTMWYCITISEKTGQLIDGTDSALSFKEVYYEGLRLTFKSDGYTVDLVIDDEGNTCDTYSGLMEIYPFIGDSDEPTGFTTESASNSAAAYDLMPHWDIYDTMSELNFVIVKVKYDADAEITSLENLQFKVENSMKDVGDVLYDYSTSNRYGAGIPVDDLEIS